MHILWPGIHNLSYNLAKKINLKNQVIILFLWEDRLLYYFPYEILSITISETKI